MRNSSTQLCATGAGRLFAFRSPQMSESPHILLDYHNVLLDYNLMRAPRPETAAEEDEYFRLTRGALRLACSTAPGVPPDDLVTALVGNDKFIAGDWFSTTFEFLTATLLVQPLEPSFPFADCDVVVDEPTMLVKRYEYANLYHQSTDYINVEIARHLLQFDDNASIAIELFDGHRHSELDEIWERVFDTAKAPACDKTPAPLHEHLHRLHSRLRRRIASRVCYKRLILVSPGYASRSFAMHNRVDPCAVPSPFYASMRVRFLRAFGISAAKASARRCIIITRRDYQAHPRNPQGAISRKFADEDVVMAAARDAGLQCTMIDLARMPVETQMQEIAQASILMGVHGAGLSYVFMLPPSGTLIEARVGFNLHFENLAGYTGRRYIGFESFGSHSQGRIEMDQEELVRAFKQATQEIS
jgi:hypothetical protein